MNTLYAQAVQSIRTTAQETQARLDAEAATARANCLKAYQAAALAGVDTASPVYPIAALVSHTIMIGRDDGYPAVQLPAEVMAVLKAANAAGILAQYIGRVKWDALLDSNLNEWDLDYTAWDKARTFRAKQIYTTL